jgi:pyrroline-5-carboxylate reductase
MTLDRVAQDGLVLLGCGKMGSALLAGWLKAGCRRSRSGWSSPIRPTG